MFSSRRLTVVAIVAFSIVFAIGGALLARTWLQSKDHALTAESVIGRWEGHGGGLLVVKEDMTFDAAGLPNEIFDSYRQGGESRSGSGRWRLTSAISDPGGPPAEVLLLFDELAGNDSRYAISANARRHNGEIVLYFFLADPDLGRTYDMSIRADADTGR